MPNYYLTCLSGTCVVENNNYPEPRTENYPGHREAQKDLLGQTFQQEHWIPSLLYPGLYSSH